MLATVLLAPQASAVIANAVVKYDPVSKSVYGNLPTTDSYTLNITAPSTITFPVTVSVELTPTAIPLGTADVARTYIQFSATTLTFTSPGQTLPVTIDMSFPTTALSPEVPGGSYTYQIKTIGWPAGVMDNGATISASVSLAYPPPGSAPAVTITTPADGQVFEYAVGALPATIPFTFDATTLVGSPAITSVSATFGSGAVMTPVAVTAQGLNSGQVTASGSFVVSAPGTYTLQANAVNSIGAASDSSTYVIKVLGTAPTVSISQPLPGSTFEYRVGDPATVVNFSFSATSSYGGIRTLTALVDGAPATFVPTGLNTLNASGTILLPYTTSGAHTVSVTATDDYGTATAESSFTINVIAPTPVLVITAPTDGQVFTLPVGATNMNVPYTFTTTSNNGFLVNSVSASLGATVLTPTTVGLGTAIATSTGTLQNLTAGTYTLTAAGTSAGVTATDSVTFTIVAPTPASSTVSGEVFFDLDVDGIQDPGEFGLFGVRVKLVNASNQVVDTEFTGCHGAYSFEDVPAGTYTVEVVTCSGFGLTTPEPTVTVAGANVVVPDIGIGLDFRAIGRMRANGYTIGFWKNNLEKAVAGKTKGAQVSKSALEDYTEDIGDFAQSPFDHLTMKQAISIMGSNSSQPKDLLAKQLLASEYNYQNGAYLNGNPLLTYLFLVWGEQVLSHPSEYSSSYIIWAKDWFDAYNNSHGGVVDGPAP